jgi:hypothetical protein
MKVKQNSMSIGNHVKNKRVNMVKDYTEAIETFKFQKI